jgi:hypothetical protein
MGTPSARQTQPARRVRGQQPFADRLIECRPQCGVDPLHGGRRQRLAVPIAPLSQTGEEATQVDRPQLRDRDPAQAGDQVNPHMIGVTLPGALADGLEGGQPVTQPLRHRARCAHGTGAIGGGEFAGSLHSVL